MLIYTCQILIECSKHDFLNERFERSWQLGVY